MKIIFKRKAKNLDRNLKIDINDTKNARSVLFSVFSRYGDAIISFVIIKEFIKKFPEKRYILITTPQHLPYAKEILNFSNIEIKKFNKKNPIDLISLTLFLKKENIDLVFNPWSFGEDSEYFLSFGKKYTSFKNFKEFTKLDNLYDRVREYLFLPIEKYKNITDFNFDFNEKVLIAPYSTDITKNLSIENIKFLKKLFPNSILALPKDKSSFFKEKKFIFKKTEKNSENFLNLLKKVDLFIGVDSGPLHIALALNKKSIGIFGPTSPLVILNNTQKIKIIRNPKLKGIFCFVKNCKQPKCIHNIINNSMFQNVYDLEKSVRLEENKCPLE
jgi:ADP-heptose:LPS heptosyltransferase